MAMGLRNPIIEAGDTLKALSYILVVGVIVYVVYRGWAYGYLRPASIGHTEPFEKYMEEYVKDLTTLLRQVRDVKDDARFAEVQAALGDFVAVHAQVARGQDLLEAKSDQDYSPHGYPQLYALLIFYQAIQRDDKTELSMLNKFIDHSHVHQYYAPNSTTTVQDITLLQRLRSAFGRLRVHVQVAANQLMDAPTGASDSAIIALCTLDKLLNQYVDAGKDNIVKSYNLRKSGGRNAIIFRIYMSDYATYVFKETIPSTWRGFGQQVKQTARTFQDFFSSEPVRKAVERLPFQIAGVENFEGFEDFKTDSEKEAAWKKWEEQRENGEETVEGFINVLKAIAKTFIGMFKLVIAAVKVVTDPAAFVRFILGLIIGMVIYVLYLVVQAISLFFIVPAFFFVLSYKLLVTVIWTAIFCVIALVYVVLWVLDFVTGGAVLKLLRCENLPNAWHTKPGFARGNVFKRNLMCGCRCSSRYYPTGFMCKRMPSYEPVYCPQALIFNAYNANLDPLRSSNPYLHQYKPTASYYVQKTDEQRRDLWGQIFDNKQEFDSVCREAMRPYDSITRRMCSQLAKDEAFKHNNPVEHAQVMELCRMTYCGDGGGSSKEDYCTGNDVAQEVDERQDIIVRTAQQWIWLLLAVTVVALVYGVVRPKRVRINVPSTLAKASTSVLAPDVIVPDTLVSGATLAKFGAF